MNKNEVSGDLAYSCQFQTTIKAIYDGDVKIPDGWRFEAFRPPTNGEWFMNWDHSKERAKTTWGATHPRIIIKPVEYLDMTDIIYWCFAVGFNPKHVIHAKAIYTKPLEVEKSEILGFRPPKVGEYFINPSMENWVTCSVRDYPYDEPRFIVSAKT